MDSPPPPRPPLPLPQQTSLYPHFKFGGIVPFILREPKQKGLLGGEPEGGSEIFLQLLLNILVPPRPGLCHGNKVATLRAGSWTPSRGWPEAVGLPLDPLPSLPLTRLEGEQAPVPSLGLGGEKRELFQAKLSSFPCLLTQRRTSLTTTKITIIIMTQYY